MLERKDTAASIKHTVSGVKRNRWLRKIIAPALGATIIMLVTLYVSSVLFNRSGSFTVSIKDFDDRKYALSLSESDSFRYSTSALQTGAIANITNTDGNSLPEDLNDVDGVHNGENYLAYTFYLKNTGEETCSYKYSLVISKVLMGLDSAARVRVYYNDDYYKAETDEITYGGSYTDYAKPKTGGNGEPEVDPENRVMTNFYSNDVIANGQFDNFAPGDMAKITVVIWLEGNDPDCTDDVLGGRLKLDMVFNIVDTAK